VLDHSSSTSLNVSAQTKVIHDGSVGNLNIYDPNNTENLSGVNFAGYYGIIAAKNSKDGKISGKKGPIRRQNTQNSQFY
jgi:hypothetical protein